MEFLRVFWDTVVSRDSAAQALDEATRFPICHPDRLSEALDEAGLRHVTTSSIDVATEFSDFNDYWRPFLSGQGSAPSYVAALSELDRGQLVNGSARDSIPTPDDWGVVAPRR